MTCIVLFCTKYMKKNNILTVSTTDRNVLSWQTLFSVVYLYRNVNNVNTLSCNISNLALRQLLV
jgi:hypothetical protein